MKHIFAFLLCCIPLMGHAQTAEEDRGYLTGFLEDNLSDAGRKVTVTGFEGALSSEATIKELTIADDQGIWLTLRGVVLDWNRASLLKGNVSVNKLTADEIIIARAPIAPSAAVDLPAPEAQPFALPELPVSVYIGELSAKRIDLGESLLGQPVSAQIAASLSLDGGTGKSALRLERLDNGPKSLITLQAAYSNETRHLVLDLAANEDAGGIMAGLMELPGRPQLAFSLKGEGPLNNYQAVLHLASDGQERLSGNVRLDQPDGQEMWFEADLKGDPAPLFLPQYADFFGNHVQLLAKGQKYPDGSLAIDALDLNTKAMQLTGQLAFSGDRRPAFFAINGTIGQNGTPVLLPFAGGETYINQAKLDVQFDAQKGDEWRSTLTVLGVQQPDVTLGRLDMQGRGTIAGAAGGPAVTGKFDLAAQEIAPADPALARAVGTDLAGAIGFLWQDETAPFVIDDLRLTGADYQFTGQAQFSDLKKGIAVAGMGHMAANDISRFSDLAARPLGGRIATELQGKANLLEGSFNIAAGVDAQGLKANIPELDHLLKDSSTIHLSLMRDYGGTTLRELAIKAQNLDLSAQGTISTAHSDIRADLVFNDLRALGGPYGGALTGRAQFAGTAQNGTLTFNAAGQALTIGQKEADALLKGPSTIDLNAKIQGQTVTLEQFILSAASLMVTAKGTIAPTDNALEAKLTFKDLGVLGPNYRGSLSAQTLFKGSLAKGQLTAGASGRNLRVGQAEADKLLAGKTDFTADIALNNRLININNFVLANPQMGVKATGQSDGETHQVTLTGELQNLGLIIPNMPGKLRITGNAGQNSQNYRLDLKAEGPSGVQAAVKGSINHNFSAAQLGITATAKADLANSFIEPRAVSGNVRADMRLDGPLNLTSLAGQVRLDHLRVSDPNIQTILEKTGGVIQLAKGRAQIDVTGRINSGGSLAIKGNVGMTAPFAADIGLKLSQVVLKDPELYQTRLNGDLALRGPVMNGAMIAGSITLAETELQIPSGNIGNPAGLDQMRHIGESRAGRATRANAGLIAAPKKAGAGKSIVFPLAITINAPQRIFVRGRGLDMELGGSLQLTGTTGKVVPVGGFDLVRGRLDILGKRLTLEQASLKLEGDFDPYLAVVASSTANDVVSSVKIEGSASDPKISFVSQPELPEEEVISQLLFGRDLSRLSAFQAVQLAGAIATLAGKGGDGIIAKMRKSTGLDDLDVSTNEEGETSLKAGKYISSKAYTEFEVGQDGKTQINLNLDLSTSVTVRGSVDSTGETSIGIFKEKDY